MDCGNLCKRYTFQAMKLLLRSKAAELSKRIEGDEGGDQLCYLGIMSIGGGGLRGPIYLWFAPAAQETFRLGFDAMA